MNSMWPILIVVAISVISSIVGKLKEQAEINRAREAAKRRYEDQIRTGDVPNQQQTAQPRQVRQPPRQPPPIVTEAPQAQQRDARLREIAARRQAELRELRERQARMRQQAGQPNPGTAQQPVRQPPARVVRPGTPRTQQDPRHPQRAQAQQQPQQQQQARNVPGTRRERERSREIAQTREIELQAQRDQAVAAQRRLRSNLERDQKQTAAAEAMREAQMHTLSAMLTSGSMASRRHRIRQAIVLGKPIVHREGHLEG